MSIRWPIRRRGNASGDRVAVMKNGDRLELVASRAGSVIAAEETACGDNDTLTLLIKTFCDKYSLDRPACSVVLAAPDYQMLLVEAPPVEPDELAEALRWKVKDLLNSPVENSVVDGFLLPENAYRGRQKMAYTIACNRSELQAFVDTLKGAGLEVDSVEVPELALMKLMESPDAALVEMVIVIGRQQGFLSVVANGAVYLTRSLELSDDALRMNAEELGRDGGPIDNFLLEMQRSRDYFESQVGVGIVGRVSLAPVENDAAPLLQAISDRLGINVEQMQVSSHCQSDLPLRGVETLMLAAASLPAAVSRAA